MTKLFYGIGVAALLILALCGYFLFTLTETIQELETELALSTEHAEALNNELSSTTAELIATEEIAADLARSLQEEKERNEEFEEQIEEITGTVGKLDKLSKIDPELLQKYSKVYFLNEHYMPEKLREINETYRYSDTEPEFLDAQVIPFFNNMVEEALEDGVTLSVVSAFRSFDEQEDLKGTYLVTYGSGANSFSADQGYSEHQLGTTVDFTTDGLGGALQGFETTPAYTWLLENAHKYGFVLSYPPNNAYYIYEPWHWRFVGEKLARDLHEDETYFYDMDQRELDEYLISIFD